MSQSPITFPLRCGRLDKHDAHDWRGRSLGANWPQRDWRCNGHVVTTLAEQEWADSADFDEAQTDKLLAWGRDGRWAS